MKIHIAYLPGAKLRDYEKDYVPLVLKELRGNGSETKLALEENPDRADVIILWEGFEYKTVDYITLLENELLLQRHAERLYCINYEDHPDGMLAGIYTSLEDPFFNPAIHRIWPFILMNNPMVYDLSCDEVLKDRERKWLFSFAGAASHDVRKRLFALFSKPSSDYCVRHVKKWYNHDDSDRREYLNTALDSVFCLCPHGYCSYTPRITEVMSMARVPVIIADDWIPFSFEEKIPYYIQVPEKNLENLPEILSKRRGDSEEYRRNARMLWEKYCSVKRRAASGIECIEKLAARPGPRMSYAAYRELWHSKTFLENAGWTPKQQFALRLEQRARKWFPAAKIPGVSPLMRYRNAPDMK